MIHNQDTICAIATAQGGAIGSIRVSGENAIEITDKIFIARKGKKLTDQKGYTLTFGQIIKSDEVIDEVLIGIFHAPNSYTGENTVEIYCHGSSYILQQVMQLLILNGCRSALPGEFTQRAFLNGKMDLSQAEAVADLISSSSAATHRLAMNQMKGGFSKQLNELRDQLLHFTSMIELELDFSEEDVEFANREQLRLLAEEIENVISKLADSFNVGNAIKNGVPVAIIGETNAGKSTLLNTLLREDKAIVSDIHGTTRDIIEDTINIQGITFRFIDTAGIRETEDRIESLGIERTFQKINQADIILWIIDSSSELYNTKELSKQIAPLCNDKKLLLVFNKSEIIEEAKQEEIRSLFKDIPAESIFISAKQNINISQLESIIVKTASLPSITQNDVIVTNVRHYEALISALEAIKRVRQGLEENIPGDLLSMDLHDCLFALGTITTNAITNQEVLENIFKNFCVGK